MPFTPADFQGIVNQIAKAGLTSRPRSGPLANLPSSANLTAATLATMSETQIQDILALTGGWVH